MTQNPPILDLLIVGAGPIGLNCGIEAKKAGLSYLIVEKGVLVNSLFNFPTNMTFFSTSNLLEIGEVPFISHTDKPTRKEALEYFRRVYESWKLNIQFFEKVEGIQKQDSIFNIHTSKGNYRSRNIVVATGFYDHSRSLNIKGEDLPKVKHYYNEPHPYINQKLLIVGAGNSACDVALETYYKGAEVTMVVRKEEIKPSVKYWIRPNIINRIKEGSIKAHFSSTVEEIRPHEVILNTPEGRIQVANDFVLAMTGYLPDYHFFEKIGLAIDDDAFRTPSHNEETLETNVEGLYLAGVIGAGMNTSKFFIENTRIHAEIIAQHILYKKSKLVH